MFKEKIRGKEYFCLDEKEMEDVLTLKKIASSFVKKGDSE